MLPVGLAIRLPAHSLVYRILLKTLRFLSSAQLRNQFNTGKWRIGRSEKNNADKNVF